MNRLILSVCLAVSLHAMGCGPSGPETGDVSGTLTVDGKPGAGVRISFMPVEGGRASTGVADEQGYYELAYSPTATGALIGKHNVTIMAPEPGVDAGTASNERLVNTAISKEAMAAKKQVEVQSGSNEIDLTFP